MTAPGFSLGGSPFSSLTLDTVAAGALRAGLSAGAGSFNAFTDRIAGSIRAPLAKANKALLSTANPYARQSVLQKLRARPDPVLDCDWIAAFATGSPELPWEYIDGFSAPSLSIGTHEHFFNGKNIKTASTLDVGDINLTVYNDSDGQSLSWLSQWASSVIRPDGFYNLPGKYKKDIVLYLLDAKRQTVFDFLFQGCMPTTPLGQLDLSAQGQHLTLQITCSVDRMFFSSTNDLSAVSRSLTNLIPQFPLSGFAGGG